MSESTKNRAADIEQQKEQRLEAIRAHCRTLRGDSLLLMQQTYPELFDDNQEEEK